MNCLFFQCLNISSRASVQRSIYDLHCTALVNFDPRGFFSIILSNDTFLIFCSYFPFSPIQHTYPPYNFPPSVIIAKQYCRSFCSPQIDTPISTSNLVTIKSYTAHATRGAANVQCSCASAVQKFRYGRKPVHRIFIFQLLNFK